MSIERLNELIAAAQNNYSYRLFPDYDHQLGGLHAGINVDVIDPSVVWIRKVVTRDP